MSEEKKYFLARYDSKTDQCIGVYDDIEEAIKKVYGYTKNHRKYKIARNSIIASYNNSSRKDGYRRTARGIWYKIPISHMELDPKFCLHNKRKKLKIINSKLENYDDDEI